MNNFLEKISDAGWVVVKDAINGREIAKLNNALEIAYLKLREIQTRNKMGQVVDGSLHHLILLDDIFINFLDNEKISTYVKQFFDGKNFIVNSYGAVINKKNNTTYTKNMHKDVRSFLGGKPIMLNLLVMLDDFTLENGATYLLSGSHKKDEKPDESYFYKKADRALGKAGSFLFFDSNIWHATGENKTQSSRKALTITFTLPFVKQQLDYPRALGYDKTNYFSDNLKQILGYKARVPASFDEWYQPVEKRMYQKDQEQ
jgi:ectoine hydroxylase-related dioxygenase (phytanoyl-CoA dioxygenase family)